MQSGLRAATEGRLGEAERLFKIYLASEDPNSASAYSNLVSGTCASRAWTQSFMLFFCAEEEGFPWRRAMLKEGNAYASVAD